MLTILPSLCKCKLDLKPTQEPQPCGHPEVPLYSVPLSDPISHVSSSLKNAKALKTPKQPQSPFTFIRWKRAAQHEHSSELLLLFSTEKHQGLGETFLQQQLQQVKLDYQLPILKYHSVTFYHTTPFLSPSISIPLLLSLVHALVLFISLSNTPTQVSFVLSLVLVSELVL